MYIGESLSGAAWLADGWQLMLVQLLVGLILARRVDERYCFFSEVAAVGDLPFVEPFGYDGSDETDGRVVVGEGADHVGLSFDLSHQSFQRIG